jgi:hypothetical protein
MLRPVEELAGQARIILVENFFEELQRLTR